MKAKILINILLIFALVSCQEEQTPTEDLLKGKVKTKQIYNYIDDTTPIAVYEYQYNSDGEIEKIVKGDYVYEQFEYNEQNILTARLTFHYSDDSLGWVLNDSTSYEYENGNVMTEETFYFSTSIERELYNYEYENSTLTKKYKYYNQQFESLTTYMYSGNCCVKETIFKDSLGVNLYYYITHEYEESMLMSSEKYNSGDAKIQSINYTYDEAGNLITLESIQLDETIVNPLYYVYRYEYY